MQIEKLKTQKLDICQRSKEKLQSTTPPAFQEKKVTSLKIRMQKWAASLNVMGYFEFHKQLIFVSRTVQVYLPAKCTSAYVCLSLFLMHVIKF